MFRPIREAFEKYLAVARGVSPEEFSSFSESFHRWRTLVRFSLDESDVWRANRKSFLFSGGTRNRLLSPDGQAGNFDRWELDFFWAQAFFARLIRRFLSAAWPNRRLFIDRLLGDSLFDVVCSGDSGGESSSCCSPSFLPHSPDFYLAREFQKIDERFFRDQLRDDDPFGKLYRSFFPKSIRQGLGEFYTPVFLARQLVEDSENDSCFDSLEPPFPFPRHGQESRGKKAAPAVEKPARYPLFRLLDPSCGSGIILRAAWTARKARGFSDGAILRSLAGFDLQPLAVVMARAAWACLLLQDSTTDWDRLPPGPLPIFLYDSVLGDDLFARDETEAGSPLAMTFSDLPGGPPRDFSMSFQRIVGNPPWIRWDRLPADYRAKTAGDWRRFGLFNLSGKKARFGGGRKEFAGLFLYAVADRFLTEGGRLSMVIPMSLLKSGLSGEGFRRFRIGGGREAERGTPLALLGVGDWTEANPFPEVQSPAATILWEKGRETDWPVPVAGWSNLFQPKSVRWAIPSNPRRGESSLVFLDRRPDLAFDLSKTDGEGGRSRRKKKVLTPNSLLFALTERADSAANPSSYQARLGANTAGANGVYWLRETAAPARESEKEKGKRGETGEVFDLGEKTLDGASSFRWVMNSPELGKRPLSRVTVCLESALLFPLLRWGDVGEFFARPSGLILIPQDPVKRRGIDRETMARDYPRTLEYLTQFESVLTARAAWRKFQSRSPFWSIYNLCESTFSPIKVVWRRFDSTLRAAAILPDAESGRTIIPQETLSMVAVDSIAEADYLAARLNSEAVRHRAASVSLPGTKSFGSPGILPLLGIERFDRNKASHRRWSEEGKEKRSQAATRDDPMPAG